MHVNRNRTSVSNFLITLCFNSIRRCSCGLPENH